MRGCAYSLHLLRHFPPFPHTLSPLFRRVLEECSKPASAISHGSAELLKPVNAASQRGCGSNRSVEKSRVCGGLFSSSPHLLQQHKLVHLAVILVQSAPRRQRAAYSFLFSSPLRSSSSSCEKAERRQPHNHESLHARVLITFPQIKCDKSPCALAGCTPEDGKIHLCTGIWMGRKILQRRCTGGACAWIHKAEQTSDFVTTPQ